VILVAMMQKKEMERRLGDIVEGRIRAGEPIARHTTLKVGGPADLMVFPKNEAELRGVLRVLTAADAPWLALGAGADLIVRDGGFRGVCISFSRHFRGSRLVGEYQIDANAGESFASLLRTAREATLSGFEFLATVPGTVGGGVATNVGAFGTSFADRLVEIEVIEGEGRSRIIPRSRISAAYRRIELPERSLVARARFALTPAPREEVEKRIREYSEKRKMSQPLWESTAGCIFKNPSEGEYAGRLIDRAGLKGLRVGGASVSERHANFIVNDGGATAEDVLHLIEEVRARVREQFGFQLEPEVRIVGEA